MSDPPKSVPTFSFGAPATSGGSNNPFGSNTPKPSGGGHFGSSTNPPTTASSNLFGNNFSTAPTNQLFGSNTQKPSPFGVGQQASGGGSIVGGGGKSGRVGSVLVVDRRVTLYTQALPQPSRASPRQTNRQTQLVLARTQICLAPQVLLQVGACSAM